MTIKFRATETTQLSKDETRVKSDFFKLSFLQPTPEFAPTPEQDSFDASPDDFFLDTPRLTVRIDPDCINKLQETCSSDITISVVLKEGIYKRSALAISYVLDRSEVDNDEIVDLNKGLFTRFSLINDIYVDLLATVPNERWGPTIVGFKRFSLLFGLGKGLFSPIPKPAEFFIQRGAGEDAMWLVEIDATDSTCFTDLPATEVLKVFINESSSSKFGRLCNVGVAGDLLSRLFVVDVISEALYQMLKICPDLPTSNDAGSLSAKMLDKLDLGLPDKYQDFRSRALNNAPLVRAKVQNLCEISSVARTTTK